MTEKLEISTNSYQDFISGNFKALTIEELGVELEKVHSTIDKMNISIYEYNNCYNEAQVAFTRNLKALIAKNREI